MKLQDLVRPYRIALSNVRPKQKPVLLFKRNTKDYTLNSFSVPVWTLLLPRPHFFLFFSLYHPNTPRPARRPLQYRRVPGENRGLRFEPLTLARKNAGLLRDVINRQSAYLRRCLKSTSMVLWLGKGKARTKSCIYDTLWIGSLIPASTDKYK